MRLTIILSTLFLLYFQPNNLLATNNNSKQESTAKNVNLELYILRKGSNIKLALFSKGTEVPSDIIIERMSTAPLSSYRKIISLTPEQLKELKTTGKTLLNDDYPESRQLDSYYRIAYTSSADTLVTLPEIFLSHAAGTTGVTFGNHREDEKMFITEEDKIEYTYEEFSITFKIERMNSKVLITIGAKNTKLRGEWTVERKSAAPLATFRKTKTISGEDLEAVLNGERVFLDAYPESRKLDSYYRLVIIDSDGVRLELPPLFLAGDPASN